MAILIKLKGGEAKELKTHNPDDCPKKPESLRMYKGVEKHAEIAGFCDRCECKTMMYPIFDGQLEKKIQWL